MTFLLNLQTLITSKAVAVGAGTALVAGGLAVASPDVFLFEPAADETEVESLVEDEEGEAEEEQPTPESIGEDEPVEDAPEDAVEDAPEEEEGLTGTEEVLSGDDDEPAGTEEVLTGDDDPASTGGDGEERSQTARDVHRALTATDGNADGLSPGDEGFGQAVAANARARGGNGKAVSEAARGERGGGDDAGTGGEVENGTDGTTESGPGGDDVSTQSGDDDSSASEGNGRDNRPARAGSPRG